MLQFISMFLILIWWVAAVTVLLPVTLCFMLSKTIANKWQSFIFGNLGFLFQPPMTSLRKRAFQILKDSLPDSSKSRSSTGSPGSSPLLESHRESTQDSPSPLEILEIGVADGANLPFYPENSRLTVLDVNADFESYFWRNAKRWGQVEYKGTIIAGAEDMRKVKDNSLDVVVMTYVLCSCKDPVQVLKEVKRVLKPGGKYLFLEHINFKESRWSQWLQKIANPIWTLYFNGCVLDRESDKSIRAAGFTKLECESVSIDGLFIYPYSPQIIGMAVK